jgi:hypothetical protein
MIRVTRQLHSPKMGTVLIHPFLPVGTVVSGSSTRQFSWQSQRNVRNLWKNDSIKQSSFSSSSSLGVPRAYTQQRYFRSSTFLKNEIKSRSAISVAAAEKLILGGNAWSRIGPTTYSDIVRTAIRSGITTFEAGSDGGDAVLRSAVESCYPSPMDATSSETSSLTQDTADPIRILKRIGYRTIAPVQRAPPAPAADNSSSPSSTSSVDTSVSSFLPFDILVEQIPDLEHPERPPTQVVHNLGSDFIRQELQTSAVVQMALQQKQQSNLPPVHVIAMIHNPEVQGIMMNATGNSNDVSTSSMNSAMGIAPAAQPQRQDAIGQRLTQAFIALEGMVEEGIIAAYGISSIGLGLPPDHPMHLSASTVIRAALQAQQELAPQSSSQQQKQEELSSSSPSSLEAFNNLHLQVIELPANVLEPYGLQVARELQKEWQASMSSDATGTAPPLQMQVIRPLTSYPDRDVSTGKQPPQPPFPVVLADYRMPTALNNVSSTSPATTAAEAATDDEAPQPVDASVPQPQPQLWTHHMNSPPEVYEIALKKAISHFDADELIEAKQRGDNLTTEQRETLDGCRLLQSMLHDMDVGLENVQSLQAHEQNLYEKIIPLIHDTFEGYDEESSEILESFFKAYSWAVRYAVAKNTRYLLTHGDDPKHKRRRADGSSGSATPMYPDLPSDMRLQEYALRFLLQEPAIHKLVVGCSHPEHVLEDVDIVAKFLKEQTAASLETVSTTAATLPDSDSAK